MFERQAPKLSYSAGFCACNCLAMSTASRAQAVICATSRCSSARSAALTCLLTPPGTEPVPCTRLPAVTRITS